MQSKIVKFFNNFMWCLVYTLPLILFIGVSVKNGALTDFNSVFSLIGCGLDSNNIIYTAFDSIFGASGVMPLFTGTAVISFATYYASCYLVHFICDVVLWLVRWCHNLINKEGKSIW